MFKKTPKLGQHFLTRPEVAHSIALSVELPQSGVVVEVGPGHGILTKKLLTIAKKVVAIEKDEELYTELTQTFAEEIQNGTLLLIQEDVRNFSPHEHEVLLEGYSVIANIPYYITGQIIRLFLTTQLQPSSMALLMQKEVAQRIVAKDGKHSLLSLSVHAYGTPKIEKTVKAGAFSPPPKVDSAVLTIQNISRNNFKNIQQEELFFSLIHAGFANKRKMLKKQIQSICPTERFTVCKIQEKARAEDLLLEQWLCLSSTFSST